MLPPCSVFQGGEFTRDEIDCALSLLQLSKTPTDALELEQLDSLVKKSEDKLPRRSSPLPEQNRNLTDQEKLPKRPKIVPLARKPKWVLSAVPEIKTLDPALINKSEDNPPRRPRSPSLQQKRNLSNQEKPPKRRRIVSSAPKHNWVLSPLPQIENLNPALITECSRPFVKELSDSDTKDEQCRFPIVMTNYRRYLENILSRDEITGLKMGLRVTVYDEEGVAYGMTFKEWTSMIVLIRGWMRFVSDHGLKVGDFVGVWMFRRRDRDGLCFAMKLLNVDKDER